MIDEPRLSEAEWDLVVQLLDREKNELPHEIHHTRTRSLKHELQDRRKMVDEILDRLACVKAE